MPELWRRACAAPCPPQGEAGEVSRFGQARGEGWRLRRLARFLLSLSETRLHALARREAFTHFWIEGHGLRGRRSSNTGGAWPLSRADDITRMREDTLFPSRGF